MKLADMKHTAAQRKARDAEVRAMPMEGADYHHGLRVSLDHDGMNKVGMKDTPKPGDEFRIEAHGRVVSASENQRAGQKEPERRVEILLHRMGAEPKMASDDGQDRKSAIRDATDKWEGSAADKRNDAANAKRRGMTQKEWEGSKADERTDRSGQQRMGRG